MPSFKKPEVPGRGSWPHRLLIQKLRSYLEGKGFSCRTEYEYIDLAFKKDNQLYAVELELTESSVEHASENLMRNIDQHVHHTFVVALNKKMVNLLEEKIRSSVVESCRYSCHTIAEYLSGTWVM